jgi:protein required for attachment to host cells
MHTHANVWFVLVNGAEARILLRRSGQPHDFEVVIEKQSPEAQLHGHELVTDRQGRSYESAAPSRHAVEGTDPHKIAMTRFESSIADLINQAAEQGQFEQLVLVAPPHTLGDMRKALSEKAKERLILEEGKDLLGMPDHEMKTRLSVLLNR